MKDQSTQLRLESEMKKKQAQWVSSNQALTSYTIYLGK